MTISKNTVFPIIVSAILAAIAAAAIYAAEERIDEKDVPSAVLSAFQREYPSATVADYWKTEENGAFEYEIKETDNMQTMEVVYRADGRKVKTIAEISIDSLPARVQNSVKTRYAGEQINMAEKVRIGDETQYEVQLVRKDNRIHLVVFDIYGTELSERPLEGIRRMGW
jgi:hypothetical protein